MLFDYDYMNRRVRKWVYCVLKHEEYHVSSPRSRCDRCCKNPPCVSKTLATDQKDEECFASAAGIKCLLQKMPSCNDSTCEDKIINGLKFFENYCRDFGGDVYQRLERLR